MFHSVHALHGMIKSAGLEEDKSEQIIRRGVSYQCNVFDDNVFKAIGVCLEQIHKIVPFSC